MGDGEICTAVDILAVAEVAEIRLREERLAVAFGIELAADEDVLLVQSIALAESRHYCGHQTGEVVEAVGVGGVFLHGVLHLQDGGILAGPGVEHADAVDVLHRKIDVAEHMLALAASAEGIDRNRHAQAHRSHKNDDIYCHNRLFVRVIEGRRTTLSVCRRWFIDAWSMHI